MPKFTEIDIRAGATGQSYERGASIDTLLAGLSEKQLRRIVQALAAGRPELVADIEREVQRLTQDPVVAMPAAPVAHSIVVDLAAVRQAIRNELRLMETGGGGRGGYHEYWDDERKYKLVPMLRAIMT